MQRSRPMDALDKALRMRHRPSNRQQDARAADTAHRAKVNRKALEAFTANGLTEACAKQAITLIVQGKIPAIALTY